jgi:cyclomaltodextrinase
MLPKRYNLANSAGCAFFYYAATEGMDKMNLEALYHRPKQNWAFAYDLKTVFLRIRAQKDDMTAVFAIFGDKYVWNETEQTMPMYKLTSDTLYDYWEVSVQPPFRRLSYLFRLESGLKQVWLSERGCHNVAPKPSYGLGNFEYSFLNPADIFQPPAWVKDAVFYQIFPERFANGDTSNDPDSVELWGGAPTPKNYYGGDLQGVLDHLDYLKTLGITAIYFNPLFQADTNHKYDTSDYLKVDAHFGSNELLKELVAECHNRGIRVLLDAVFNHCGHSFPPFLDVLEKGQSSPFANWFHVREWPLQVIDRIPTYETFAFEPIMPKLNTENQEVIDYLLKVAHYWIKEIDVDGWRLDVADEVDHRFWRKFRDTVKSAKPDAYILGEIWHNAMPWLQGDQFDAIMNYPITEAALNFFARDQMDGLAFAHAIGAQLANYPLQANEVAFNLLGSHDTPRLLSVCKGNKDRMKLAAVFQFTYPGAPCIYYGDEIGLEGDNDPGCRKCMEWDTSKQDLDLFDFFKSVITLRKTYSALRTGGIRFIYAKLNDSRLAYERWNDEERYIVLLNASMDHCTMQVTLPSGKWQNVWNDETFDVAKDQYNTHLPAFGFQVLRYLEH